jgi:hypothetical protein
VIRRALLVVALAGLGCAQRRALGSEAVARPPGSRGSPDEAFGRQAIVTTKDAVFHGELVTCDSAFIYLYLNVADQPYAMVPWKLVVKAQALSPGGGSKAGTITWTVLGSLSTATHGYWSPVSGAVWGAVGAGSIFWAADHDNLSGRCEDLRPYTRYPQGLPKVLRGRYWGPSDGAPQQ